MAKNDTKRLLYTAAATLLLSVVFVYLEIWFLVKGFIYLTSFLGLFGFLAFSYDAYKTPIEIVKIEQWANETKINVDSKVESKPFKIEFDQKEWDNLVKKLELSRFFEPLNEKFVKKWVYGFDPEYAKEMVEYWKTKYDWKSRLNILNKYPQFQVKFDDVTLHYIHFVTNENQSNLKKVNLLLVDGWPGAYFSFNGVIEYLNDNYKDYSFDITVPSIPGYGYSIPLDKPLDAIDSAQYFDALMRFVHKNENVQYYIHGEDWGSFVSNNVALLYPNRVKGLHLSMPLPGRQIHMLLGLLVGSVTPKLVLSDEEIAANFTFALGPFIKEFIQKTGYLHVQATIPDSMTIGLSDSPVGLMSYVLYFYSMGSFKSEALGTKDGNLNAYNRDELLDIITFYYMSNSFGSATRFYKSNLGMPKSPAKKRVSTYPTPSKVPTGVQYFKNEAYVYPHKLIKKAYPKLIRFNREKVGGHFANFENPKMVAKDFVEFIKSA